MSTLITTGQLTLYDYNDALIAGTPPTNPQVDTLWLDTSTSPNMMKRWNGAKWDNIGELDPQYTEKIETITGNITEIEKTLGNMADDGKLDLTDRQDLVDKLIPIIGYIPSSTETTLKTAAQLDSLKKGSFSKIRESAVDAGILTTNTAYTGLATAWTNLRAYLNGLSPKPWDIGTANEKNDSVVVKATFRTHWLNYYNAEYSLATATSKNLNTAITAINNTTIPALQNASLSNSEKAAINQSLLVLTSEKTGMNGEVVALKSNPKFLSQAALDTAKSNYDAAYSSVSSAIASVMAVPTGTLIPSNLIGAVETAILQYGEKLSALQREIQNAQTAISNKISADASAELSNSLLEYVDKTSYGQDIATIQSQVDGAITTWFGDSEPTLLKAPAKDWNTNLIKDTHLGDLYYDNISGYGYRFGKEGTLYRWIRIVDADVVAALAAAQNAQDTADGKRRAFYNQPKPPYDVGDLWVQGEKGELMQAKVSRAEGASFVLSDWKKAVKYTDDTAVDELEIGGRNIVRQINIDVSGVGSSSYDKASNTWSLGILNGATRAGLRIIGNDVRVPYGKTFILSFELLSPYDTTWSQDVNNNPVSGSSWNGNDNDNRSLAKNSARNIPANVWTKCWFTYTNNHASNTEKVDLRDGSVFGVVNATGVTQTVKFRNVKGELGNKPTEWTPAIEDVDAEITAAQSAAQDYATGYIADNVQPQIDGKMETYNQTADPSTGWTTQEKTKHKGDLWYHPTNKITKLWSGSSWTTLEDAVATGAQQLAQSKNRVFTSTPTTPYEIGDLWVQGTSGDLMRCVTSRASGSFNVNDWGKAVKYTDDTKANAAATAASNAQTAANNAQADAKKANDSVSDIISDSRMTPDEKVILQREWLNIQYERNEILSQAERYVIDNASYRSVYDTLSGYLAPFFTNLTTTQDVNAETLRSNFQRYYEQRQAILDAISVAAQQKVLDLQTQVDAGPFADKTDVLSGNEIFTDKADDSVVHVDIDGKSIGGGTSKNLFIQRWTSHWPYGTAPQVINVYSNTIEYTRNNTSTQAFGNSGWKPEEGKTYTVSGYMFQNGQPIKRSQWGINGTNRAYPASHFYIDDKTGYFESTQVWGTDSYIFHGPITGVEGATVRLEYLQIEEGSTATAYEPPAPTPDYPIEIHSLNDFDVVSSVGKRNYALSTDWVTEQVSTIDVNIPDYLKGERVTLSFYLELENGTSGSQSRIGIEGSNLSTLGNRTYYNAWYNLSRGGSYKGVVSNEVTIDKDFSGNTLRMNTFQNLINADIKKLGFIKVEKSTIATSYSPAPEDITENDNHPLIDKTNILLSEPLRSVGDVKDRLFRDNDGLWKVERNVGEYVFDSTETIYTTSDVVRSGYFGANFRALQAIGNVEFNSPMRTNRLTQSSRGSNAVFGSGIINNESSASWYFYIPKNLSSETRGDDFAVKGLIQKWAAEGKPLVVAYKKINSEIEILDQYLQDKLNNITSYKDSNYLYTIVDKTNILPSYAQDNLKPNLRATFKSKTWYQNYKRGDDLRHFVEVKGLDRAIRFGMLVDYQSFAVPTANWLYFCKIQTNTDDFREELVDEDGSIFDYTTQREIKVPKQALDLRGVAEGTAGYLAFDTRNQLMWFIHYQRNYTYTTNQKTGIIEKIPSSEYWIKWNPGKTGHNTQLVLDESVYIVGEIER